MRVAFEQSELVAGNVPMYSYNDGKNITKKSPDSNSLKVSIEMLN